MKTPGPLRHLANEIERHMLPQVASLGLRPDPRFPDHGKWNRIGYEWRFLFPRPSDDRFVLAVRVSRKKSTILSVDLIAGKTFASEGSPDPSAANPPPATQTSTELPPGHEAMRSAPVLSIPLSALGEFFFLEWLNPGTIPRDWYDRIWLRVMLVPLALLWFAFSAMILLLSIPVLGYRNRGERSKHVASGVRQRKMVARATRIVGRTFHDGVPKRLVAEIG